MSEVRFILRDAHRTVSSTWHGSCADAAVAALSADPETIEELEVAIERYMKPWGDGRWFRCFGGSLNDEPYDAGLVVIDLAARLIAAESSYSSPGRQGTVWYHNGECGTNIPIRYQLADEWLITSDILHWRPLAEERRAPARPIRHSMRGPSCSAGRSWNSSPPDVSRRSPAARKSRRRLARNGSPPRRSEPCAGRISHSKIQRASHHRHHPLGTVRRACETRRR